MLKKKSKLTAAIKPRRSRHLSKIIKKVKSLRGHKMTSETVPTTETEVLKMQDDGYTGTAPSDEVKPSTEVVKPVTPAVKAWAAAPRTYYSPWQRQNGFLQPDHMTRPDRFPKIFETAQKFNPNAKRVLSFGCSTGEECQSLRKYFPNAEIVGVDLDYTSIQKARKNNKDPNIHFHTDLGATGKYDVVLCLMVFFCMDCPVTYGGFSTVLKNVHKYINEDGHLLIYTSDHNPSWVEEIATEYEPLNVWTRTHDKNKKDYYNGYYRRLRSDELPPKTGE
jgi:hypothetical protein